MSGNKNKKILFVCTEDWFFYSHFLPLISAANEIEHAQNFLAASSSDKSALIEKMGVTIIPVDFDRASTSLFSVIKLFFRLSKVFWREKPDLIHFIALKPIVVGAMAAFFRPRTAKIYHLTGQGFFTLDVNPRHQKIRRIFFSLITFFLRRSKSWLLIENPDDAQALRKYGDFPENRQTILGGAGVDPDAFPALPPPRNKIVHLGFVGRLVWSKGIDVLIEAMDLLQAQGIAVHLDIYGEPDEQNPRSVTTDQLALWNQRSDTQWQGRSENVKEVWKRADIVIVPSRGGEGMPRAMLEAASCARPLIVSDVPGCRHFVRDGTEGFVVPPQDPQALAQAISKLVEDKALRTKMGKAARQRILDGFTEDHVIGAVANVYRGLLKE